MLRRRAHFANLFCALLLAVGVSWFRLAAVGTARVDGVLPFWHAYWPPTVVAIALGWLARWYIAAWKQSDAPLPVLAKRAFWAHALVATCLPLTSNDLFMNLVYGRVGAQGLNPYTDLPQVLGPQDPFVAMAGPRWLDMPMCYGPVVAWLTSLAARVGNVLGAAIVFKLFALAAVMGAMGFAYTICREMPAERGRRSFLLFALSPALLWELSGQAHNDVFMVLAVTSFLWAAGRGHHGVATACLALGLCVKAPVLPLALFYVVYLSRRDWRAGVSVAVGITLVTTLVAWPYWAGMQSLAGLASVVRGAGGGGTAVSHSFVELMYYAAWPFGQAAQHMVYRAGWTLGLVTLAAMGLRGLMRVRTFDDVVHQTLIVYLTYCLITATWFQSWYVVWLLPLGMVHQDKRWQWVVALYSGLTPFACAVHLDPLPTVALHGVVLATIAALVKTSEETEPMATACDLQVVRA